MRPTPDHANPRWLDGASPLGYMPPMQCIECEGTNFAPREVSWTVTIGGHDVVHALNQDACVGCGWWGIAYRDLGWLELLSAQRVLLDHAFSSTVLKDVRKALGLTRATLAERLGVPEPRVVAWEVSDTPPPWVPLALGGLVTIELRSPQKGTPLVYRARIFAEDGAWLVEFDDCPGCVTFGDTFEEAKACAKEAVEGWLECHVEDGPTPPKPAATEGEPIEIDQDLSGAIRRLWVD